MNAAAPRRFVDYPFASNGFDRGDGIRMHYLDEGPRGAPVVLMLHGNPTWSYYWRHLVLALRDRFRCIVPDHIGMGLSDKPADGPADEPGYRYTLDSRVADVEKLLEAIAPDQPIILAVHDWGGMIGAGVALRQPARIRALVVTNTAMFPLPTGKPLPGLLRFGRNRWLGRQLIHRGNVFARAALRLAVTEPMLPAEQRAYLAPYRGSGNALATLRFVEDIPLRPSDPAWDTVAAAGEQLERWADRPTMLGWGLRDFVFDEDYLRVFEQAWPNAQVHRWPDAGHYVLEDARQPLIDAISNFVDALPAS